MDLHPGGTPLDKLSNRALEAIETGRFQRAEHLCMKLLRVYRKAPDGHERMGMLHMAQGRHEDALRHVDRPLQMAQKEPQYFGPGAEQYINELRSQAMAAIASSAGQATDEVPDTVPETSPDTARRHGPVASLTAGIARRFRGRWRVRRHRGREVLEGADHGLAAAGEAGLAEVGEAALGGDLRVDEAGHAEDVDLGEFYGETRLAVKLSGPAVEADPVSS